MSLDLIEIPEPELLFGYGQAMEHPKDGLLLYGPKESPQAGSKLRIGVVSTKEGLRRYSACVTRMAKPIAPALPDNPNHTLFPGFQALFGVEWPAQPATWLEIDAAELANAIRISDRHQAIHKAVSLYSDAIADSALKHRTFVAPPFKMERMTWIKPSSLLMIYRAGWGYKDEGKMELPASCGQV